MSNTDNTLPEELKKEIEKDAEVYADERYLLRPTCGDELKEWETIRDIYIAGAAEYASKLHLLQQEYEALQRWKEEAKDLLNPIFEYAQDHPDMQLGGSMIEFVLNRCKEYDKLKGENNRLGDALNQSARWLADEMAEHAALKEEADKMAKLIVDIRKRANRYALGYLSVDAIAAQMRIDIDQLANNQNESNG